MEDAPYKNTRSSAGSQGHVSEKQQMDYVEETSEVFQNCLYTPCKSENKRTERVRTPSGHLTANSVKDIRNFFTRQTESPSGNSHQSSTQGQLSPYSSQQVTGAIDSLTTNGARRKVTKENTQPSRIKGQRSEIYSRRTVPNEQLVIEQKQQKSPPWPPRQTVNQTTRTMSISNDQSQQLEQLTRDSAAMQSHLQPQMCELFNTSRGHRNDTTMQTSADGQGEDDKNTSAHRNQNQKKQEITQPKVMDLQLVLTMFKEIKTDLAQFKKDTDIERINSIVAQREMDDQVITQVKNQLQTEKENSERMRSTMVGMAKTIKDLDKRVKYLEGNNHANDIVVSGIVGLENKSDYIEQIQEMLASELNVQAEIQDCFQLGEGSDRPVVVKLANRKQKDLILQNKHQLKNIENVNGGGIYINNYQPPEISKRQNKERAIHRKKSEQHS